MSAPTMTGPEALADWATDARFLSEALHRADRADLVTIDLFDTALTRLLDSPADLFALVEQRLCAQIGAVAHGFALVRETAERQARQAARSMRGREDIGYEAILDWLPTRLAPWRDRIRAAEFDAEAEMLVAVPDLLVLTRSLAERGIRFSIVSDMYLPTAFLAERLAACGFRGADGLHVSAETGASKASGRQWAMLRALHPHAGRILHIGDDQHADIDLPRRFGVDTLAYTRARSARRTALPFTPAILPFSRARRAQVLRSRADPPDTMVAETGPFETGPAGAAFWQQLGESWGAIILAGFVRWLEGEVVRHRIRHLCFSARDGWLVLQAWRASGAEHRTGLVGRYLELSRRPLNLACGVLRGTGERLQAGLLGFLASSDGFVSVGNALRRAGLQGIAPLRDEMAEAFGGLDAMLHWPDGTGRFEQILQRHAGAVHAALSAEYDAVMGYLRQQELLGQDRIGLVDLGWHASGQRALRALIESGGGAADLHGFYYGLWPPARGNRFGAGPAWSAFASDFAPAEERPELTDAVEMLEELHGAPHGTVLGFRQREGRWHPVLAEDPAERAQHERAAAPFQRGCLDTVSALFRDGSSGTLRLDEITPEVVRATLAAITLSPEPVELRMLGGLGHHATFDHARFNTLVPDGLPDGAQARDRALRACGWRIGTVLRWVQRAGDEAPELRDWVRHVMHHYGERVLRRLG